MKIFPQKMIFSTLKIFQANGQIMSSDKTNQHSTKAIDRIMMLFASDPGRTIDKSEFERILRLEGCDCWSCNPASLTVNSEFVSSMAEHVAYLLQEASHSGADTDFSEYNIYDFCDMKWDDLAAELDKARDPRWHRARDIARCMTEVQRLGEALVKFQNQDNQIEEDDGPSAKCPCCGSEWGQLLLEGEDLEAWIARQEPEWLSEFNDYTAFAARSQEMTFDVVFLSGEDNNGISEKVVDGVRYTYQRAWLFSCPLCNSEEPLSFGYWEKW